MDLFDLVASRAAASGSLAGVAAHVLAIGIDSDRLYPCDEVRAVAEAVPFGTYAELSSPHGHDAFLIEFEQLASILHPFLNYGATGGVATRRATCDAVAAGEGR